MQARMWDPHRANKRRIAQKVDHHKALEVYMSVCLYTGIYLHFFGGILCQVEKGYGLHLLEFIILITVEFCATYKRIEDELVLFIVYI